MADYPVTAQILAKGMSDDNIFYTEHVLAQALANTDTLTISLPAGYYRERASIIPMSVVCWSAANPRLPQNAAANFVITSYDQDTGVLVLTVGSSGVADKSTFTIKWIVSTVGT